MKFLLIVLSLMTFGKNVYSNDCVDCTTELKPFDKVVKTIEALQDVTTVNCTDHLKKAAQEEYEGYFGNLPTKSAVVKGIKLQGSADEIKFITKMLGDKPLDVWSSAKECKTVLCALTAVYDSEESAHRALNIAKRDGYIISAAKEFNINDKDIGQLFTLSELTDIDLAYKNIPATFKRLKTLDRIKRMPSGFSSPRAPDAAAYASPGYHSSLTNIEGEIVFLDSGFNKNDKAWGPHVAVHELTHHVDFSRSSKKDYGVSQDPAFLKISGWKEVQRIETDKTTGKKVSVTEWKHNPDKEFVRSYAGTEPEEDLADTTAYYMYAPRMLKELDPEKYSFIKKNVFAGKEFNPEPDFNLSDEDIFKSCLNGQNDISIYGMEGLGGSIPKSCLDKFLKDYKISDPKLCDYNMDQIEGYLQDRITTQVKKSNAVLQSCNKKLEENRILCYNEGNLKKSCALEKCDFASPLKEKVRDAGFSNKDQAMMTAIENKIGKSNFLSTILLKGLEDKKKISDGYALNMQQKFIDSATTALAEALEKEKIQVDSISDIKLKLHRHLMVDKTMTKNLSQFQDQVLINATKSKEKNLEFIKKWAASQSLEDTPMFEELAETVKQYAKLGKWK